MKATIIFLVLILNCNLYSQTEKIVGEYHFNSDEKGHVIQYKLKLKPDGTYEFHSYSKVPAGISQVSYDYSEGRWSSESDGKLFKRNIMVSFSAYKDNEVGNNITINLNNSRAQFITGDKTKTDRNPEARLKFTESDVFWIEGIEVFKISKV